MKIDSIRFPPPAADEMINAILAGRKTVTRRVVRPAHGGVLEIHDDLGGVPRLCEKCGPLCRGLKPPYQAGDILYVRETWQEKRGGGYMYKADTVNSFDLFITPDGRVVYEIPWSPSIHMPKEAARIFLRVADVRVERLQDITEAGIAQDGIQSKKQGWLRVEFADLWNSTFKPKDLSLYGWEANPWCGMIEFEKISKEDAFKDEQLAKF